MTPPRKFRRLIDRVCDRDREYFDRHPDAQSYVRPYVPGESWPIFFPQGTQIRVTQIGPGVRLRETVPGTHDGWATTAEAWP